jgi:hypothetical protein
MPDAATYRIKAVEMRERAKSARDRVAHQELLNLATQYEALASHIETLASDKIKPLEPNSG